MTRRHAWWVVAAAIVLAVAVVMAVGGDDASSGAAPAAAAGGPDGDPIARGRYLALAGNCAGCHTARGEPAYSGGRAIDTPFGTVYAPNLTPDPETGLGAWTADDFWRALHEGRSRGGRLLYPAFPYPSYTRVARADADALFAYLRSVPPVRRANRAHALRFPFDRQIVLAGWRLLFFRPGVHRDDPTRSTTWNRGAYLVRGLGHCDACHGGRNALGATVDAAGLGGGAIPMQGWYAPSLSAPESAGAGIDPRQDLVALLRTGMHARGSAMGPMARVVLDSTSHLDGRDLDAIAEYLQSRSGRAPPIDAPSEATPVADTAQQRRGREIYDDHCADCHGDDGAGAPGIYPPLAGNPSVTLASSANVIRAVLSGGFPPGTPARPRPYGMPPFAPFLSDADTAAVVTYVRRAWGHRASPVTAVDVAALRGTRAD